jgi:hypothetical protein
MKIFWTIKSIPELADLSPSDRMALWRRNYWKGYAHLPPWMGVAILFILLGIVQYLTGPGHVLAATNTWLKVALKGIAFLMGFSLTYQLLTESIRPHLRRDLQHMGKYK